jgi:hypothetical protein
MDEFYLGGIVFEAPWTGTNSIIHVSSKVITEMGK